MDYEKFQGKIWRTGSSLVITIPEQIAKYGGYSEETDYLSWDKLIEYDEAHPEYSTTFQLYLRIVFWGLQALGIPLKR